MTRADLAMIRLISGAPAREHSHLLALWADRDAQWLAIARKSLAHGRSFSAVTTTDTQPHPQFLTRTAC